MKPIESLGMIHDLIQWTRKAVQRPNSSCRYNARSKFREGNNHSLSLFEDQIYCINVHPNIQKTMSLLSHYTLSRNESMSFFLHGYMNAFLLFRKLNNLDSNMHTTVSTLRGYSLTLNQHKASPHAGHWFHQWIESILLFLSIAFKLYLYPVVHEDKLETVSYFCKLFDAFNM